MAVGSEGVNESGVAEQTVQGCAIEAQSAAIARAMASICNDEGVHLGGMSGHVGFVHTFSARQGQDHGRGFQPRPYPLAAAQGHARCREAHQFQPAAGQPHAQLVALVGALIGGSRA